MAFVLLFGGRDAGGVILTEHGIKPIPPWNPFFLGQLRALSALVAAKATAGSRKSAASLDEVIESLTRTVTEAANEEFGSLGNGGILFADGEDGLYCGASGPIHVPIRHGGSSSKPGPGAGVAGFRLAKPA